jgi:hypothetical protein
VFRGQIQDGFNAEVVGQPVFPPSRRKRNLRAGANGLKGCASAEKNVIQSFAGAGLT